MTNTQEPHHHSEGFLAHILVPDQPFEWTPRGGWITSDGVMLDVPPKPVPEKVNHEQSVIDEIDALVNEEMAGGEWKHQGRGYDECPGCRHDWHGLECDECGCSGSAGMVVQNAGLMRSESTVPMSLSEFFEEHQRTWDAREDPVQRLQRLIEQIHESLLALVSVSTLDLTGFVVVSVSTLDLTGFVDMVESIRLHDLSGEESDADA